MKLLSALINPLYYSVSFGVSNELDRMCVNRICAPLGHLLVTFLAIVVIFLGCKYIYKKKD